MPKVRLDLLLVERGLAESRTSPCVRAGWSRPRNFQTLHYRYFVG